MSSPITLANLADLERNLKAHVTSEIGDLKTQQAETTVALRNLEGRVIVQNSRIGKLEDRLNDDNDGLGAMRQKIINVEREVFPNGGHSPTPVHAIVAPAPPVDAKPTDAAAITVSFTPTMWKWVIGLVGAVAAFAPQLGAWLTQLITEALK